MCYRPAEVKIPAVFNNLQLLLASKHPLAVSLQGTESLCYQL